MKKTTTLSSVALGSALALGAVLSTTLATTAAAEGNPFAAQVMDVGPQASKGAEGQCGEARCGSSKPTPAEGRCGEGKCGGSA